MGMLDPECGGGVTITRRRDLETGGSPFLVDLTITVPGYFPTTFRALSKGDLQAIKREINRALKEE